MNKPSPRPSRRALISLLGAAGVAATGGSWAVRSLLRPSRDEPAVFIARGQGYAGLARTIRDGLEAVGVDARSVRGRRVLLKPNLVEPNARFPHATTNPAMVVAAAEVFRGWGATVIVGEGPGHMRDTDMALLESGLGDALDRAKLPFVDLNLDDVDWTPNLGRASRLDGLYLPRSVLSADMVVSMPKLKTHHWIGMTCAMKNLYGVVPGALYGWPKNVLHYAGIPRTVFDINACLPPTIAVVDAIDCMEGDGPIMGTPRSLGLVVVGNNLPAVDAMCAQLIGLEPGRLEYLALAADRLGPIDESKIAQRGEIWRGLAQRFEPPPTLRTDRA